MARKRKLQPLDANSLRPRTRDLFGEVPVTRRELMLWMWKVPVWMTRNSSAHRIESYLRGWNVAYKIARAKLEGALEQILGDEACPHCGVLLEMDYPAQIEALRPPPRRLAPVLYLVRPLTPPPNEKRPTGSGEAFLDATAGK